ncbi:MAG: DUF1990 domain-containing protein [bacterium]
MTYAEIGATRNESPPMGYAIDRNRIRLGSGSVVFERAVAALHRWRMLTLTWASVAPEAAPVVAGTTVAVVVRHYGFWSLNACRIVYVVSGDTIDADGARRVAFAYGTLPEHGAIGVERFSVEWYPTDDSVWFGMYAFSRPGKLLARLGYPLGRRLQRRFARDAMRAMFEAVAAGEFAGAAAPRVVAPDEGRH